MFTTKKELLQVPSPFPLLEQKREMLPTALRWCGKHAESLDADAAEGTTSHPLVFLWRFAAFVVKYA
jgi:hypothetical protein